MAPAGPGRKGPKGKQRGGGRGRKKGLSSLFFGNLISPMSYLHQRNALRLRREKRRFLRWYYRHLPDDSLYIPPFSTKRQYRVFYERQDGRLIVKKVQDRIRHQGDMQSHLIRHAPLHVYYTTSYWLDPQNLGPKKQRKKKAGYRLASNVFLGQELFFDIDVPGELDVARGELVRLHRFLRDRFDYSDYVAVYSGSKGFHLYVLDFKLSDHTEVPADPRERELASQKVKGLLVKDILDAGIIIDAEITIDSRRIIRLPGTIHGKTLNLCQLVDLDAIDSFTPTCMVPEDRQWAWLRKKVGA